MKIEFENKQYEIDVQRAIELGICKKARQEITDFNVGDVFEGANGIRLLIIQPLHWVDGYNIAGLHGVSPYSDFMKPRTHQEMINYLNEDEHYVFVANINDQINDLIMIA
jgi:hypothetical protein